VQEGRHAEYHLHAGGGLHVAITAANRGGHAAPYGIGDPLAPDRRRKAVAIERMSCPPNAFATGDDLLVLEPGEAVHSSIQRQCSSCPALSS
jgi:aldose 1-epimerase